MFYDNFVKLCADKGQKPTPTAKEIGFSSAALVKWKNGTIPRGNALQKIADYFGVTVNDLLTDDPAPSKLHREEGEKIAVLASVGAGIPLEAINTFDQDDPDSWEEISKSERGEFFALRVRGPSMEPLIRHGDIVIVREILMLIYSGLRVGEFLALTPDDVRDGFITVRTSKTQAGRRRVPQAARTALFWQARAEAGISYIVPLSVQNDDPAVRYITFKREFKNAMNRVGLPDHLPHDTRHTTATLLHAAGVDPYIVKRILGHASQDVTEAVYTHISDDQLREAIDKI